MIKTVGVAVVLAFVLGACGGGSGGGGGGTITTDPTTAPPPSASDVFEDVVTSALTTYADGSADDMGCAAATGPSVKVTTTAASGNKPNFQFCTRAFYVNVGGRPIPAARIRNDTRVPLRLGSSLADLYFPALQPGKYRDIYPPDPNQTQTSITYRGDVQGAAFLIAEELLPQAPQVELRKCAADLTASCVVSLFSRLQLPTVEFRGYRFDLDAIVEGLTYVTTAASVVNRWHDLQNNVEGGSLVINIG